MNGRKRKICDRKRRKIRLLSRFDFSDFTTVLRMVDQPKPFDRPHLCNDTSRWTNRNRLRLHLQCRGEKLPV